MNAQLPFVIENERLQPQNPARLTWPPTLPVELALRIDTPKVICEHYGISRDEWLELIVHPQFRRDVEAATETLRKEGMSFRMKSGLMAEELLPTMWSLIHSTNDQVPPSVKADLIKFVVKAAGLDASKDQGKANIAANGLNIQINLG